MNFLTFLATDIGQILKLVLMISVPVALLAAAGIFVFLRYAKRR